MTQDNNTIDQSETIGPQSCKCGRSKTFELHGIMTDDGTTDVVAACTECGRITGSIGAGLDYRGKKISQE